MVSAVFFFHQISVSWEALNVFFVIVRENELNFFMICLLRHHVFDKCSIKYRHSFKLDFLIENENLYFDGNFLHFVYFSGNTKNSNEMLQAVCPAKISKENST